MQSALLLGVGAVLVVAGATMIVRGLVGRREIRQELSAQKIVFPSAESLPPSLVRYAGARVSSGVQARGFADLIAANLAGATAGRTYAEIAEECRSGAGRDGQLTQLRETAFVGQSLRASLLSAYQAWQVTTLVIGLGALLALIGLAFVAMGVS